MRNNKQLIIGLIIGFIIGLSLTTIFTNRYKIINTSRIILKHDRITGKTYYLQISGHSWELVK